MSNPTEELHPQLPTPTVDPPEPPRPDDIDTVSPGLTDESGTLPTPGNDGDLDTEAEVATEEPTA
jgi:hypothetical protein